MIHEEKRKGGRPRRTKTKKKSISGVTEVRGKQLSKYILTIPLQSCSLLYYNTHVRTHASHKISSGTGYENYYFSIVDDKLESIIVKHLIKPQQAS